MAAKKVLKPSAIITNEAGVNDNQDIIVNADEHRSAFSVICQTDEQEPDKRTVDASQAALLPPSNKEPIDALAAGSPSLEPENASKSPSFVPDDAVSKSARDGSFTKTAYDRRKIAIDYSKPQNNVAVKYMKKHRAKMRQWRYDTLQTLVNQQDCAVEAVRLETLMKLEL